MKSCSHRPHRRWTTVALALTGAGEISQAERQRLRASAIRAWDER